MDWTQLLDPANGGPGESPGYHETIASLRTDPPERSKRKAGRSSSKPLHSPETTALLAVPGMKESIIKGMATPVKGLSKEPGW